MARNSFLVVLFALASVNVAIAQDPIKAESTHYKLAFENEYVQVVNIHYGPHEKSGLHAHPAGVVVNLTAAHLKFTDDEGKVREVHALHGESRWFPALKHKVENMGNTAYDGVYIAVKANQQTGATGKRDQRASNNEAYHLLPSPSLRYEEAITEVVSASNGLNRSDRSH